MVSFIKTEYNSVQMTRQNASYEERGKKIRNKNKKKRIVKPPKQEGYVVYIQRNLCNTLDVEYATEWSSKYVDAYYCKDETGYRWRDFLDPPPCV
jgi:hypothetical protein